MNDQELDGLFAAWAQWCRSKRLFSPSPNPQSIIGSLRGPTGGGDGPDHELSADLAKLHLAILSLGNQAGCLIVHYMFRNGVTIYRKGVLPIKVVCAQLGISRQTYYDRVRSARRLAYNRAFGNGMADSADSGLHDLVRGQGSAEAQEAGGVGRAEAAAQGAGGIGCP